MDHTNTGREEAAIWQSSASQQAGANACTDGDNPGGTNVVRFSPIAGGRLAVSRRCTPVRSQCIICCRWVIGRATQFSGVAPGLRYG
jgi:hypothetical protein